MRDIDIRLLARIIYPFWRLLRMTTWPSLRYESPVEHKPYRVKVGVLSISGPASETQGTAQRGEVIRMERAMGDMLVQNGTLEPIEHKVEIDPDWVDLSQNASPGDVERFRQYYWQNEVNDKR